MLFTLSTRSSKKLTLYAPSAVQMSRMSPRSANSPGSAAISRRAYPAAASLSAASCGEMTSSRAKRTVRDASTSARGNFCMSASAHTTATSASPHARRASASACCIAPRME